MTNSKDWTEVDFPKKSTEARRWVAHLYRRAGFVVAPDQIDELAKSSPRDVVEGMFAEDGSAFEKSSSAMRDTVLAAGGEKTISTWWLFVMQNSPAQLLEKMTLFWHGHFATGEDKVGSPRAMVTQNEILRKGAYGNFKSLVSKIARDPAMLIYLDSTDNRKTRPNENWARELMELFCLETGNYSEKDIKEVARCFTGWEVRRKRFKINKYQHDNGVKSFFGESGNFDGDDAIRIILEQPAASRFIAKKLFRYFVADGDPDPKLLEPLAQQLCDTDFHIGKCVQTILTSQYFYSKNSIARKIRSPVELSIGLLRMLGASVNLYELANRLEQLGHRPFYPPNVKGWDGGKKWINSSTLLGRANLVREIVSGGNTKFRGRGITEWTRPHKVRKGIEVVDLFTDLFLATPLPNEVKAKMASEIERGGVENPETMAGFIHAVSLQPEFHLS